MLHPFVMRRFAFAVLLLALPARLDAQAIVAVALSDVDSVAIFDAHSLARLATLPVGKNPHEIVASPNRNALYVANAGGGSISVLELWPRPRVRTTWRLPDSISVHDLALSGGLIWGASGAPAVLLGLDAATGSLRHRHLLKRAGSWMIEPGGPNGTLVVANLEGGAVSLVQPRSGGQTIYEAKVGEIDASATRDLSQIWSVNSQTGELTIFDRSGIVVQRLHVGAGPVRVVFTPDGKTALIPLARDSIVVVFDVSRQERVGSVAVGPDPKVIAISGDSRRAYVTHPRGSLTVLDVPSRKVLRSIALTGTPDGVALVEPR